MKKLIITLCLSLSLFYSAFPQQQSKPVPEQRDDVIRVDTSLVQTSVAVFDKQGVFVDGLRPEDFQLKIDGKPQSIQFFSRIAAGTEQERYQVAAARSGQPATSTAISANAEYRGRTIVFFIDDLHLSAKSVQKTRSVITDFVEKQMAATDYVAIASATGQIGFLQQFTNHKAVLRAAIARLNHRPYVVHDTESIPMTEYAATRIDAGDRDSLTYYTNELLKATNFSSVGGAVGPPRGGGAAGTSAGITPNKPSSGMSREIAEHQVKERARLILKQSTDVTTNTLAGLESLMRTAAQQSGRKLVFFVSDGFYLNDRNTGFATKLREVTDAAVRSGVVIYSLDARGMISMTDVTSNRADPEGKLARSNIGEISASQDALSALASDTGGRALLNSENLTDGINRAVRETSNYYLLSWRPDSEEQKAAGFKRIEIAVLNRPDLTVRLPKGYLTNLASATTTPSNPAAPDSSTKTQPDAELKQALSAPLSTHNIPLTVSASFVDTPDNGTVVSAGVLTSATALDYGSDAKQAAFDLAGVILNDQGKTSASFRTRLTVNALPAQFTSQDTGVVYNYKAKITPGLYQIRAAVRDEKSGKVGSASEWVEIPDLTSKRLTLSSLLLRAAKKGETSSTAEPQFSVDHRFPKSSQLSFLLFIYNVNGAAAGATPDITAHVEVFRNGASVVNTGERKLSTQGMTDLARIPYAGQFPLESLQAGRYEIQITISDRLAKTSASQRLPFQVE